MLDPSTTSNFELPKDLPVPQDDGACDHLTNEHLPDLELATCAPKGAAGQTLSLRDLPGRCVIFSYPRTGLPNEPTCAAWDALPGARGCTPQTLSFRRHHRAFQAQGYEVFGLSTQTVAYQQELSRRLELPFPLISDSELKLCLALNLPHFVDPHPTGPPETPVCLKRMVWVVHDAQIVKVFYPVFPPDQSADTTLRWIELRAGSAKRDAQVPYHVHATKGALFLCNSHHMLQPQRVVELLKETSWAQERTLRTITRSLRHSDCYGVFDGSRANEQIALARVVTDQATFAYLCDVVVDQRYRGQGISKWIMEAIMANPNYKGLKRFLLVTRDAHSLYDRYGFAPLPPDRAIRFMEILNAEA